MDFAALSHAISAAWSVAWAHHEDAVVAVASFLVLYYQLPDANRTRIERKYPRWGGAVKLMRRAFPFLPGVPEAAKQIVTGIHPNEPPDPRDEELARLAAQLAAFRSPKDTARLLNPSPSVVVGDHAAPSAPATPSVPSPPPAEITDAAPSDRAASAEASPAGADPVPHDSDGSNGSH